MPAKITKLTPEQIARFKDWSDDWIKIGLSTEPANFDKAIEAALKAYKLINRYKPMIILRMSSPYGATLGGAIAWAMLRELGDKQVRAQVESQVGAQVRSQVESQVRSQVWSQVWSQVESQVGAQVRSQVESQVRSQVWSQVESQVGAQVESQVRSQVWSQVESQVGAQVRSQVWSAVYNYRGGSLWAAGWASSISFFRDVCGWTDPVLERFEIDEALVKNCGWVWWHENVLAISDRPTVINRDEQGRLHSELGPSIAYRDGWQLHHWHGTSVPADWIENRANLSPNTVIMAQNVEQRAAGAAIIGWPKMLSVLQSRTINRHDNPDIGELIELTLPGLAEPGRFLKAVCPRNGLIVEGVPRVSDIDGLPIETALAAQAWRIGDPQSEYSHPPRRT
jgi:hypothetical protein